MRIIAVRICLLTYLLISLPFKIIKFSLRQQSKEESLTCPTDRENLDPDLVSKPNKNNTPLARKSFNVSVEKLKPLRSNKNQSI